MARLPPQDMPITATLSALTLPASADPVRVFSACAQSSAFTSVAEVARAWGCSGIAAEVTTRKPWDAIVDRYPANSRLSARRDHCPR